MGAKKHRFRLDQVQNFYPSPLANSTTMYYTGKNPLAKIGYKSEDVFVPKGDKQRRLHKALLHYPRSGKLAVNPPGAGSDGQKASDRQPSLIAQRLRQPLKRCVSRRQNRNTRPALTKHTPMATQRQYACYCKKKRRLRNLVR